MRHPKIVVVERKPNDDSILVSQERMLDRDDLEDILKNGLMAIRSYCGKSVEGKSFYLDARYDWVMGYDENGQLVLVPLKKI